MKKVGSVCGRRFPATTLALCGLLLAVQAGAATDPGDTSAAAQSVEAQTSPGWNADAVAARRILARFKADSPFARSSSNTSGSVRKVVDRAAREMPIQGIRHLKSFRVGNDTAVAIDKRALQGLQAGHDFELSVLEITDPAADRDAIINALMATGQLEYAEPDTVMWANRVPNDPRFDSLWGLDNTGQSGGLVDADIDAPEAWDITTGSAAVVVAVVDSGVYYNHADLTDNMWRNPGEAGLDANNMDKASNNVDDDGNGYVDDVYGIDCINGDSDPIDDNASTYHGTHVAGTIGAQGNNGSQVTGVNWDVSIMALKYLGADGSGVTSDAVECLTYAANMKKNHGVNLRVTNNSYGGAGATQSMRDAIRATQDEEILFVAAAGNDGLDNDVSPHYPSSYSLPGILSVASIDRSDNKASSSNYGLQSVDLGAPGVTILSTVGASNLNTLSGTSMAAPHVAGVAALLAAHEPGLSLAQLKGRLLDTAVPIAALDGLTVTGGRVNAYDALTCTAGDVHMYVTPVSVTGYLELGEAAPVQLSLTTCGNPVSGATVTVTPGNGQADFTLLDDGIAPDVTAADSIYSALWTPTVSGDVTLSIAAVSGASTNNATVVLSVVDVPNYGINPNYPYAWHESSDGIDVGLANVDDEGANIPIGFNFNFYGNNYSDVWVHSNGMLKFAGDVEFSFFEFIDSPEITVPNNFIAPFWEDLDPSANNGAIYSKLEGDEPHRRLIVQWHGLQHFRQVSEDLPDSVTFQTILYEGSNDIVLQYQHLTFGSAEYDFAARALIGIERFDGGDGIVYLNQGQPPATSLSEQQAILFADTSSQQRTLTVSTPANGVVTADAGQINCSDNGDLCFGQYGLDTPVVLTAVAASGYRFEGWLGAGCDGIEINSCTVTMDDHKTLSASFGLEPMIVVTPLTGLETHESGDTATFTVALNRAASADVSIALSSTDSSEGSVSPTSLVFTTLDGIQPKTVTVTGVNDAIDDGDIAYQVLTAAAVSDDPNFDQLDPADVSLINNDDGDTAGITVTPTLGLLTSEGGSSDLFSLVLDSEPLTTVTVTLLSSDTSEGTLDKNLLVFDAGNWNQPQNVVLTGVDDVHDDGDITYFVQLAVSADSDAGYQPLLIPSLSVLNSNDDFAGIALQVNNTETTEAGGEASFSLTLNANPEFPVSIALASNDTTEGVASPALVLFDSGNWNIAQTVTITGVEDFIDDGDVPYAIVTAAAVSAGVDYAGLNADDVTLTNIDDDTAAIRVAAVEPFNTDEAGTTASFTVVLESEPTANVDIGISVSDSSEAGVSSNLLRFTPLTGRVAQTVIVTGLDDDLVDGDIPFTVVIAPALSTDSLYAGIDPNDLGGVNQDLDVDSDNDGIVDAVDNCATVPNADQMNSDFDLFGDACDEDDDNDGVLDDSDNCPLDANAAQKDTDSDGLGDPCDPDSDNDFVLNGSDLDALDPYVCEDADGDGCDDCSIGVDGFGGLPDANPQNDGADLDGDFICDLGDDDLDGDLVLNATDNCPVLSNPAQVDLDHDGVGDACDDEIVILPDEDWCWPINTAAAGVTVICL